MSYGAVSQKEMVLDKENGRTYPRYLAYDIIRFQVSDIFTSLICSIVLSQDTSHSNLKELQKRLINAILTAPFLSFSDRVKKLANKVTIYECCALKRK